MSDEAERSYTMAIPQADPMLQRMFDAPERQESGRGLMSVTLMIGGFLVSGMPISLEVYYRLSGEVLAEAAERQGHDGSVWRETYGELAEAAAKGARKRQEALDKLDAEFETLPEGQETPVELRERAEELSRVHLHLENVRILAPNGPLLSVPVWRGRLSQVAGWTSGELGQS